MAVTPFVTNADADTYFDDRWENALWMQASEAGKTRALAHSTRLMNRLNYSGTKTVSTQENEFPRNGGATVPQDIQDACCEIAYNLMDGRDPDFESEFINLASGGIAPVSIGKSPSMAPPHMVANIPSSIAWNLIRPYLIDPSTITLKRTST